MELPFPERLFEKAFDAIADRVADTFGNIPGGKKIASAIRSLHSEAEFREQFHKAMEEAFQKFRQEYTDIDEDIAILICESKSLFEDPKVAETLVKLMKRPDVVLGSDSLEITEDFSDLFPQRLNRERVNKGVSFLLRKLAETVWLMPEFRDIYSTVFERATVEAMRRQVLISEQQLKITTEMRNALVEFTESVRQIPRHEVKALPGKGSINHLSNGLESKEGLLALPPSSKQPMREWGEAFDIDTSMFYGREKEIKTGTNSLLNDKCKILGLFGIGGIGKSALAMKIAHKVQSDFSYMYWRSLVNAPPLSIILTECIRFLSDQEEIIIPSDTTTLISHLLHYLSRARCLIVLDNYEAVFCQESGILGKYREGYEGYGKLLERVALGKHNSSFLVTSREIPNELARLEGEGSAVCSVLLLGLDPEDGRQILDGKSLFGSDMKKIELIERYSGNPLALRIVADMIRTVYEGDVEAFLKENDTFFGDIEDELQSAYGRCSPLEQSILMWLTIEREPITREQITADLIERISTSELSVALRGLIQRSLIEHGDGKFRLQNVLMEYLTSRLNKDMVNEIASGSIRFFATHCLIKATSKVYVRETQTRMILSRVANELLMCFGGVSDLRSKLMGIISGLQAQDQSHHGYAPGNILNILAFIKEDLYGADFSALSIRQAFLQETPLRDVNFECSNFSSTVFGGTFGGVLALAANAERKILVAASIDGNVYIWDLVRLELQEIVKGHSDWVRDIAINSSGELIATASYDQTIKLWDIPQTRCRLNLIGHSSWVTGVDFVNKRDLLASSSEDRTIKLWDTATGKCSKTLYGHEGAVHCVKCGPNGNTLASGASDGTIRVWDAVNGECVCILRGHNGPVVSLSFDSYGRYIASGGHDGDIRIWDLATQECVQVLTGHSNWVLAVTFVDGNNIVASGSADQTMRIWDVPTGQCKRVAVGHSNWVGAIESGFNESKWVATGSLDQTVRLWDSETANCIAILRGHDVGVKAVAFSRHEELLISGSNDGVIRVWDIGNAQCQREMVVHARPIWSIACSPTADMVATGSEDDSVLVWDLITWKRIAVLPGHTSWVYVRFSRDGRLLATCDADAHRIRIWDVNSWNLKVDMKTDARVWGTDFSPNGKLIACANYDKMVRIWDIATGDLIRVLSGHKDQVWGVEFSPDGSFLASASEDKTIRIWDTATWSCCHILEGHKSWILTSIFSPDCIRIASEGSDEDLVRLWDIKTGTCVRSMDIHKPWSLSFSQSGNFLAAGSYDGTVYVWNVFDEGQVKYLRPRRLYEGMRISKCRGLNKMQRTMLIGLGAIDESIIEGGGL